MFSIIRHDEYKIWRKLKSITVLVLSCALQGPVHVCVWLVWRLMMWVSDVGLTIFAREPGPMSRLRIGTFSQTPGDLSLICIVLVTPLSVAGMKN